MEDNKHTNTLNYKNSIHYTSFGNNVIDIISKGGFLI